MIDVNLTLVLSVVAATIMAAFGYLKNQNEEAFSPTKFFTTYITAFSVALLFVAFNVPVEVGDQLIYYFFTQTGAIAILERIYKFLWRTYIQPRLDKLPELGD